MVAPNSFKNDLPALPNEWSWQPIGECFDFKNGLNKAKHFFGYGKPIINYMDVFAFSGIYASQIRGKVDVDANEMRSFEVKKGDVLFTRTSETVDEVGISCAVLDEVTDTVFSGFVLRGRPKNNKLNDLFKKYVFSSASVRKQITSKATYTTRALTNGRVLSNILIPVPDCEKEQQAIAEALSDADALIATLEKIIEKQQKIFSHSLKALNFESYSFYGIGGRFIRKKLCELSEIVGGYAFPSASYSHQGEWNIVTISAIQDGYFAASELNKIKSHPSNLSAEQILKENDLLITLTGNVGRVAKVPKGKFLLNQRVAKLIPNKIEADFLYYSLRSEHFIKHLNDEAVGGAQGNISNKDILDYEIFIPNITGDMARILAYLREIDQLITAYSLELDKAKKIKAGMMQELLTGRTRLI
jgi:type I restriction enzyme S subunit